MPTKSTDAPVQTPPQAQLAEADVQQAGQSRPKEVHAEHVSLQGGVTTPTLTPPGVDGSAGGAAVSAQTPPTAVTGTWSTNVTVDATWSINETRNAFFHTSTGAWKKVFNGTDSAFDNLVALASQAKQTGHPISFREEADGMTHEIYLW